MKNQEDYPKIIPEIEGKYVTDRDIFYAQSCYDKEQRDQADKLIKNLSDSNPDIINQKRRAIIDVFSYFDKDDSGIINVSEMRYILESLDIDQKNSYIDNLITQAEIEGNGYISYRDFAYNIIK